MNVTDDPREFAEAVAALVDDRDRWKVQRRRIARIQNHWATGRRNFVEGCGGFGSSG